jgi:glycosyltransferase involved in cell wall biosynthesis
VAISDTIKARILRNYSRTSVVIAPPVDTDYYQPDTRVKREDFYLAASALVPYKLIDQAVEACNRLGKKLVVIGSGPELENLRKLAGPTVQVLGFQPDEVLRDHLRRCQALIFPGDEDFGILPIEALACGTPVIALGRGGVAETVDDSVGRLYQEPSVESLCQAIVDWEAMPQNPQLARIARQKAERFAVDQFDQAILSLINSFQIVRNSAESLSNIKVKAG